MKWEPGSPSNIRPSRRTFCFDVDYNAARRPLCYDLSLSNSMKHDGGDPCYTTFREGHKCSPCVDPTAGLASGSICWPARSELCKVLHCSGVSTAGLCTAATSHHEEIKSENHSVRRGRSGHSVTTCKLRMLLRMLRRRSMRGAPLRSEIRFFSGTVCVHAMRLNIAQLIRVPNSHQIACC